MDGHILAIYLGSRKGSPKTEVTEARLLPEHGIEGDAHAGLPGSHQLTLLSQEAIRSLQPETGTLRAEDLQVNLVTEGIVWTDVGLGRRLHLGGQAVGQIVQIGWGCDETSGPCRYPGTQLRRRAGIAMRVVTGGTVKKGDPIATDPELDRLRYAIVTLSDRASSGETEDLSGPLINRLLSEALGSHQVSYRILPDDEMKLASHLSSLCDEEIVDLIVTTGGTGLGPRDRTPEATRRVIDREIPGIAEAVRAEGLKQTPHAMLSRAVAGLRGHTLIVNLSGSPRAVQEQMAVVLPILPHAVEVAAGIKVRCARSYTPG